MNNLTMNKGEVGRVSSDTEGDKPLPTLALNPEDYREKLEDMDIPNKQARLKSNSNACHREITKNDFFESLELTDSGRNAYIACDFKKFDKYFNDDTLSEQQKTELLEVLWNFVVASISFNLGIHPMQQASENCGKLEGNEPKITQTFKNLVDSGNSNRNENVAQESRSSAKDGGENNA